MTARFAWPQYREPWQLYVTATSQVAGDVTLDLERRRLTFERTDWSEIRVAFSLTTTQKPPVDLGSPLTAYVLVSSPRTNMRFPVPLEAHDDGGFGGQTTLVRSQLAGAVDLKAQLVLVDGAIRVVGESDDWVLVVDESAAPPLPGAPPFAISWVSFGASDSPPQLTAAKDTLSLFDLTAGDPVLYLNKDVEGFEAILNAERPRLEKKRLRDSLAAETIRRALSVLVQEALAESEVDEEGEAQVTEDNLLRQMLDAVADQVDSVESSSDLVHQMHTDPTSRRRLRAEIETALDRLTSYSETHAFSLEKVHYGQQ